MTKPGVRILEEHRAVDLLLARTAGGSAAWWPAT